MSQKEALLNALRSIWQECQFWNRIFEEGSNDDFQEIKQLLDEDEAAINPRN
jgi:hypothetical protein